MAEKEEEALVLVAVVAAAASVAKTASTASPFRFHFHFHFHFHSPHGGHVPSGLCCTREPPPHLPTTAPPNPRHPENDSKPLDNGWPGPTPDPQNGTQGQQGPDSAPHRVAAPLQLPLQV